MNTRRLPTLAAATLLSIIATTTPAVQPEQEIVVSRPVSVARGIPPNTVSRPVTVSRGIPLNVVSRPATVSRAIPLNIVSRPVTIGRGIPLNVVSRPFTLAFCPAEASVPGEPDCNNNGLLDICDIANCTDDPACDDCNGNDVPDECDISSGTSEDCQPNRVPDECDIEVGTSEDVDGNGIPDECMVVPTFSEWGLIIMTLLLLTGMTLIFGRRRPGGMPG